MSDSSTLVRQETKARERSELERRRVLVARLRWLESNLTVAEIVGALRDVEPPINVSLRTVERDLVAIRDDARRYLNARNFDARAEVGMALARFEMLARMATKHAGSEHGESSKWARVAIRATEAKMILLQHIGLIDRQIGTLFIDDGREAKRIPSGTELAKLFESVKVLPGELVSEAESAWRHGDYAAADAAARDAEPQNEQED